MGCRTMAYRSKVKVKKKKSSMLRTATFCQLSHRFHLVNSSIFVTHVFRLPPTVFARGCHSNVRFAHDWVEGWQCSPPVSNDDTAQSALGSWRTLALQDARKSKERTYPELLRSRRCRLVVLAIETGGRWSPEATTFLRLLAQTKARAVPNIVRKAVEASLLLRWSAILTHAAQHAFAASLLHLDCAGTSSTDGDTPSISQLLSEAPPPPPPTSRLPARP